MKLVRCCCGKEETYGILTKNGKMLRIRPIAEKFGLKLPKTLEGFVRKGIRAIEAAEEILKKASEKEIEDFSLPLNEVRLLAPLAHPPKIICLGLNYLDHIEEDVTGRGKAVPSEPIIFIKPHTTIIGYGQSIIKPSFVKKLDYEAELAIVMGARAKNVSAEEARSCIFGYTILNDVTARDIQLKDIQWTRGKSFDTFAPIGPCIVTQNQIPDPTNLYIRTWVNGELRQNSTTKNMIFNVYEIVHHISRVMTLEPCDIIATGTPAGVGYALKPEPKFLQDGDIVRIEIEGIGTLENKVAEVKF
jgi:2-keto-4-pentenoate hydratase/2-oxohepta-3-ene-1,7-dioic acid hydratase in catechol pathway